MKSHSNLDKKINTYLNKEFTGIGESQQLYELKEELSINLKERTKDYEKKGQTEDEAFKEAVSSMGDLSGLKEDMRRLGEDQARKEVYTSMASRVSAAGLIVGILVIVFGALTTLMLSFMDLPSEAVTGPAIFIVAGGALITYSLLTRETSKYYAMTKVRALLYTLAVGTVLFSLFTAFTSGFATGEMFIAISSFMVFFIIGLGLWLSLLFTVRTSRRK
ncbi:permease prefix domain 1-containing protein [Halobacillus sp. A5]|uniref:permease prefix domain 1-containing protein n=1 Tax=Halobacillus sp. A5 TaxID=2880263 RepID=UPI0020A6D9B2|nr:permease prefix domain 1-containing protein [Halobacillus sp. A5]MCP3027770.1 permease prefix domain 1-containing protein [Halobacillus sp. A5]